MGSFHGIFFKTHRFGDLIFGTETLRGINCASLFDFYSIALMAIFPELFNLGTSYLGGDNWISLLPIILLQVLNIIIIKLLSEHIS